jgi:hypothetical protein
VKFNIAPLTVEELEELRRLLGLLQVDPLIPAGHKHSVAHRVGGVLVVVSHCINHRKDKPHAPSDDD